jgi:hypothetical protein
MDLKDIILSEKDNNLPNLEDAEIFNYKINYYSKEL